MGSTLELAITFQMGRNETVILKQMGMFISVYIPHACDSIQQRYGKSQKWGTFASCDQALS